MPATDHKVAEAKAAAKAFIAEAFYPNKMFGGKVFQEAFNRMGEFVFPQQSAPEGRIINGKPIDFYCPSFWHVCCSVLYRWAISRFSQDGKNAEIIVFRGQTNPWEMCPNLWRPNPITYPQKSIEALQTYLVSELPREFDQSFEAFPDFQSISGVTALAQHHEFPTNYLDFTYHPLVALYFAGIESNRADINDTNMTGHGVIFEIPLSNFHKLSTRTSCRPEFVLVPPAHVPRLYQQQGFFIDAGDISNKYFLPELRLTAERIFFPRQYPEIADIADVFSEPLMIKYLGADYDAFRSPQINDVGQHWYLGLPFYLNAVEGLKEYCSQIGRDFNIEDAVSLMKQKNKNTQAPFEHYSKLMGSSIRRGMEVADHLSKVALFILEIAYIKTYEGYGLDYSLVLEYAKANPALFETMFEVSKRVELFGFNTIIEQIMGVDGVKEIISNSLTQNQLEEIKQYGYVR